MEGEGDGGRVSEGATVGMNRAVGAKRGFVSPFAAQGGVGKRPFVSPFGANGVNGARRVFGGAVKPASASTSASTSVLNGDATKCFVALYAKRKAGGGGKQRSAKTFMDGIVIVDVRTNVSTLLDMQGKRVAKANAGTVVQGTTTSIGNYEVEIAEPVAKDAVDSGAAFSMSGAAPPPREDIQRATFLHPTNATSRMATVTKNAAPSSRDAAAWRPEAPLYSDTADGALVLSTLETNFYRRDARTSCAVVVDPFIARHLRPHQRDGVAFMFECVMGTRASVHTNKAHTGCLLAHEMGLGKTLQVIALIWTLLKQSPFKRGAPTCRRVVVCVPASLVGNWGAEFKKWLGPERVDPQLVEGGDKQARELFQTWALPSQRRRSVLITSYETLRAHADALARASVDLLICDEAHRLKNATNATKGAVALTMLNCTRRVLLTGTPIQNDLDEFFAVMDFACPGLMGDLTSFRKIYAAPIGKAGERGASEEEKRIGAARRAELGRLTQGFIHARKADEINASLLPSKTEYVVFIRLTPTQEAMYIRALKQKSLQSMLGRCGKSDAEASTSVLGVIQNLQKLCNAASLVEASDEFDIGASSKLLVLRSMFRALAEDERIVVVSGFTTTLDVIARVCADEGLHCARLQGSVPANQRSQIVKSFNASGKILLLSTKAGGTGLNLIGANRLVLVDSDWNPANDLQATARVWRDGQTKPVSIYRLLSTGTMEERLFQRQELKGALARTLGFKSTSNASGGGASGGGASFTQGELRDLFSYVKETRCDTADRIQAREGANAPQHWLNDASATTNDALLARAIADGGADVSFVCQLPATTASAIEPLAEDDDGDDDDDDDEPDAKE